MISKRIESQDGSVKLSLEGNTLLVRVPIRIIPNLVICASGKGDMAVLPAFGTNERRVFDGLIKAKANKEIAAGMNLSVRTVKFYVSSLLGKFGVKSRGELRQMFIEQ
jgi:DNA-binding NarL/FixJ family response regulator